MGDTEVNRADMQRINRIAAFLSAVLLLAGCAGGGASPAALPGLSASANAVEGAAQPVPSKDNAMRAVLILEGAAGDSGWNSDCCEGMRQARDIFGYEITVVENVPRGWFQSVFSRYAGEGARLVVAPGQQYQEAVRAIYQNYPQTHFAGINFDFTADNVTSLNFNNVQAGFLAGALAALTTQTNSVGYIGGDETPSVIGAMRGMGQGIKFVKDGVQFTAATTGTWTDAAKAGQIAQEQIVTHNVDVIFTYSDAGSSGVIAAARGTAECIVMNPVDPLETAPGVICGSVLISNSAMILFAADLAANGAKGTAMIGDVANGVVRMGSFGRGVDSDVAERIRQIYQGIAEGSIEYE